ncbi:MAG: peroxiredoxin [Elusimicrobiota bacterium]|nr:peroxiredoxin [Elusimicrobiota bacterium]
MNLLLALALAAGPASASDVPLAGAKAPEFALAAQDGRTVALKELRGRWVVLYFYPKDFTGGCTLEARGFEKNRKRFAAAKAVVLGVSMDSAESHKDFCAKEGLGFKLLSDAKGEASAAYGSLRSERPLSARNTFLINPEGTIAKVWLDVSPAGHAEEVLAALTALRAPKAAK